MLLCCCCCFNPDFFLFFSLSLSLSLSQQTECTMVVSVFDSDGGGTIDFKEFAAAIKFAHRLLLKEIKRVNENKRKNKNAKMKIEKQRRKEEKAAAKEARAMERRRVRFANVGYHGHGVKKSTVPDLTKFQSLL